MYYADALANVFCPYAMYILVWRQRQVEEVKKERATVERAGCSWAGSSPELRAVLNCSSESCKCSAGGNLWILFRIVAGTLGVGGVGLEFEIVIDAAIAAAAAVVAAAAAAAAAPL